MLAVFLALGAALGWGTADFFGGLKSRSMPMLTVLLVSQAMALVLLLAVLVSAGEGAPALRFILQAVVAGLAEGLGVAALYRGLSVGTMSIVAPVSAIAPAVPLAAGLLLGEVPGPMQNAGLVLIVIGVILTSRQRGEADGGSKSLTSSILYGLLSALGFGIFFVALGAASEGGVPWALFVARFSAVAALVIVVVASRARPAIRKTDLALLIAMGVLIVAADAMYAIATTQGLISVVAVIGALHTVVTVALARICLREQLVGIQRIGVAVAFCGVLIVSAA
jgi:drug/metabolite transporter (DMT)-like permease